jgi:hypothetical protein
MGAGGLWKRNLFFKCLICGAVTEAPLLAWLAWAQVGGHLGIIPMALFLFHRPSSAVTGLLIWPIQGHVSNSVLNWLAYPLMGVIQAILIGCAFFAFRLKKRKDST